MKLNCKFLYAIGALISVKLFFLSIMFGINGNPFGYQYATTSDPMEAVFRILFILFIISPPLLVILLFLIWKEMKKRNQLK